MLELPASAQLLAASATAPNEVWTVGDRLLAIQGHPEMDPQEALAKIHATLASNGCAAPKQGCIMRLNRAILRGVIKGYCVMPRTLADTALARRQAKRRGQQRAQQEW